MLFSIVGELGAGKTLSLTFLTYKNWFFRRQKVYSNYHLYKIPYIYLEAVDQLTLMRDGIVAVDELWRICDTLLSRSKMHKLTSDILGRSRKRKLNYIFTAQLLETIAPRVRKVIDFVSYPLMNRTETICKIVIFRGSRAREGTYMKTVYFKTDVVKQMYDTDEEIDMEEKSSEPPKIIFQESKDAEPEYFNTWEEADKRAEEYWLKNQSLIKEIF